jgi:Mg2+/Co2+ transporter CorB
MLSETNTALLAIAGLMFVAAFFSGAETGFTASSRAKLTEIKRRGSKRANHALDLSEKPENLIYTLLLGSNFMKVSATAVATYVLVQEFGTNGIAAAALIMAVVILALCDVLPKTFALSFPERTAMSAVYVLRPLVIVLAPFVAAVSFLARTVFRLFGFDVRENANLLTAHDELRGAIDLHHQEETLVKTDRDMLGGILDLKNLEVADIMVHRTKMAMLDGNLPLKELVRQMLESPHTRMPVWKDKPDNIVGVLHAKTLFAALQKIDGESGKLKLEAIMSPAWFVPDTRPLEDQLNAFLRQKLQLAIVVDEYGEVQGIVTLEDILEEIVGDIKDEFDAVTTGVRKTRNGSFVVDGTVPIRDLNRTFDWKLPDEEATTIAGLVIHEARMIPQAGQAFSFFGFRFEVLKKRRQQLTSLKITPLTLGDDEADSG